MLEKLVEKFDENPSVGVAFAQSWDVDSEGNKLHSWKQWTDNLDEDRWSKDFVDAGRNECQYLFLKCTIPNSSGVLLRRQPLLQVGKLNPHMKMFADWMLWATMLTISDLTYVAEPLNYFRTPTNGISLRLSFVGTILDIEESLQVFHYLLQAGVKPPDIFWKTMYLPIMKW